MDKKSKILLVVLLALTVISVYLTYRRAFITKDYEVVNPPEEQALEEDLIQ